MYYHLAHRSQSLRRHHLQLLSVTVLALVLAQGRCLAAEIPV